MSENIERAIEAASDRLAQQIVERAVAKAGAIVAGKPTPVVREVSVDLAWSHPAGEIIIKKVEALKPKRKSGRQVDPASRRQRAFAFFAKGMSRKQVKSHLKLPPATLSKYARDWNDANRALGRRV